MIDKTTSAVLGFGSLRESLLSAGAVVNFRKQGAVHFEYTRSVALEEGKAKALKKDYNLAQKQQKAERRNSERGLEKDRRNTTSFRDRKSVQ